VSAAPALISSALQKHRLVGPSIRRLVQFLDLNGNWHSRAVDCLVDFDNVHNLSFQVYLFRSAPIKGKWQTISAGELRNRAEGSVILRLADFDKSKAV
jgi:hypothetical protein